jgi:hypothetical protein
LAYAQQLNPTYANFNIVTPYPGTEFFAQCQNQVAEFDFSKYDVYHAVLKCRHLTPERVGELHGRCFERFYFRMRYLRANAHLLWPWLRRLGIGPAQLDDEIAGETPSTSECAESGAKRKSITIRPDAA